MIVAILANEGQKLEILGKQTSQDAEFIWADSVRSLKIIEADVYFDLLFENDSERISALRSISNGTLFVNSVIHTTRDIGDLPFRINGWPFMIGRSVVEIAASGNITDIGWPSRLDQAFAGLQWKYQLVPDIVGMITPRIISMIINEAWFGLGEGISSREEIDTAMKLGTNHPYGPFEWGEKISMKKVVHLLEELEKGDKRYAVAPLLKNHQWR